MSGLFWRGVWKKEEKTVEKSLDKKKTSRKKRGQTIINQDVEKAS